MYSIIEHKNQILFLYIPLLIALIMGFISHYLNLDDKNLDVVFAVWPLVGFSSIFFLGFVYSDFRQLVFLLAGILFIVFISFFFYFNLLPIKNNNDITLILLAIYFSLFLIATTAYYNNKLNLIMSIYNLIVLSIIPFALMGYILVFIGFTKVVYSFF